MGGVIAYVNITVARIFVFFVLFTSFVASDAVYMNRVIIPDENVMIRMKLNHLLAEALYIGMVAITDSVRIIIEIEIGLVDIIPVQTRITIISVIFFCFF